MKKKRRFSNFTTFFPHCKSKNMYLIYCTLTVLLQGAYMSFGICKVGVSYILQYIYLRARD